MTKQIKVSTTSEMLLFDFCNRNFNIVIMHLQEITWTTEQRHQLIKRMEPLAEENEKLKEAVDVSERNNLRAQRERDLAESNAWDLEYQKGVLSE